MKFIIAFVCFAGIAIVSSAPVAEESSAPAEVKVEESVQERAAEIPLAAPYEGGRAYEPQVEEKAAEVEEKAEIEEKSEVEAKTAVEEKSARADRALLPSPREIIEAIETKYLTPDGRELLKSIVPFA